MNNQSTEELLALGVACHQQNKFDEAKALYQRVLQLKPKHPEALHLSGLLFQQHEKWDECLRQLKKAVKLVPKEERYLLSLGNAQHVVGEYQKAYECFRALLKLRPNHDQYLHKLGSVCLKLNKTDQAIEVFKNLLTKPINHAPVWFELGIAYQLQSNSDEAIASYQKAVDLDADQYRALNNLGCIYLDKHEIKKAALYFQQAIQIESNYVKAHSNLAETFLMSGELQLAESTFQHALLLDPKHSGAHNGLAKLYMERGQWQLALAQLKQAMEINPNVPEVYNHLGSVYQNLGDLKQAAEYYCHALSVDNDYRPALFNQACLNVIFKDFDSAYRQFKKILKNNPDDYEALAMLIHVKRQRCNWNNLPELIEQIKQIEKHGTYKVSPFSLITLPDISAREQLEVAQNWMKNGMSFQVEAFKVTTETEKKDVIHLAYLSADFHSHATAYLLARIIELHDRSRFKVFAYSYGPDENSAMRQRLTQAFDQFTDITQLSFHESAQQIRHDKIDILIDLKGFTQNSRSEIMAYKASPIQINYLGYPGTMGAEWMDYIIVDSYIVTRDQEKYFSEKFAYMPHCYQPNDNTREIAVKPERSDCGLPDNAIVFCAFHQAYKINEEIFNVWCQILNQTTGTVLWLLSTHPKVKTHLCQYAQQQGIALSRLIFAEKKSHSEHLARLQLADLYLDTFPVNAHTSASDALWAGVPVVTMSGDSFISRVAGSLLNTMGLQQLVCTNFQEYKECVLQLIHHPEQLEMVKQQVIKQRQISSLFDSERYTQDLECLLLQMWERHLNKKPLAVLSCQDD